MPLLRRRVRFSRRPGILRSPCACSAWTTVQTTAQLLNPVRHLTTVSCHLLNPSLNPLLNPSSQRRNLRIRRRSRLLRQRGRTQISRAQIKRPTNHSPPQLPQPASLSPPLKASRRFLRRPSPCSRLIQATRPPSRFLSRLPRSSPHPASTAARSPSHTFRSRRRRRAWVVRRYRDHPPAPRFSCT